MSSTRQSVRLANGKSKYASSRLTPARAKRRHSRRNLPSDALDLEYNSPKNSSSSNKSPLELPKIVRSISGESFRSCGSPTGLGAAIPHSAVWEGTDSPTPERFGSMQGLDPIDIIRAAATQVEFHEQSYYFALLEKQAAVVQQDFDDMCAEKDEEIRRESAARQAAEARLITEQKRARALQEELDALRCRAEQLEAQSKHCPGCKRKREAREPEQQLAAAPAHKRSRAVL